MSQPLPSLFRKQWYFLNDVEASLTASPIRSFAMDDTLCHLIGQNPHGAMARSWIHKKTIVLGIQDHRLPYINEGVDSLKKQGYEVIVRNSGGLAVVLDEGVYNLSLIFPEEKGLTIDRGYELMVELVRKLLGESGHLVMDGEIKESYCPGRYDLSIFGKKFAGISQRRIRGGIAVQIYIAFSESGAMRAQIVKDFYQLAVQDGEVRYEIPNINPNKMASLQELLIGEKWSVDKLQQRLISLLGQLSSTGEVKNLSLSKSDWEAFEDNLARMIKRNEQLS